MELHQSMQPYVVKHSASRNMVSN